MAKITKEKFMDVLEGYVMPVVFPPGASVKLIEQKIHGTGFSNADKLILEWQGQELKKVYAERDDLKAKLKETEERLEQLRITYQVLNNQYVDMLETIKGS